jgi:hypothetical protein
VESNNNNNHNSVPYPGLPEISLGRRASRRPVTLGR